MIRFVTICAWIYMILGIVLILLGFFMLFSPESRHNSVQVIASGLVGVIIGGPIFGIARLLKDLKSKLAEMNKPFL